VHLKSDLQDHIGLHTDKFVCPYCFKFPRFGSSRSLIRHIKVKHPDDWVDEKHHAANLRAAYVKAGLIKKVDQMYPILTEEMEARRLMKPSAAQGKPDEEAKDDERAGENVQDQPGAKADTGETTE